MSALEFAVVDRFPEPAFSVLQREVFSDIEASAEFTHPSRVPSPPVDATPLRVGAYRAGQPVGRSYGWGKAGGPFYLANSGVVAALRRQGVYSQLVRLVLGHGERAGCVQLTSRHLPTNNAVIIAKLRLGFQVCAFEHSAEFGPMVHLVRHLRPQNAA